jgi:hypothetical protein
MRLVEESFSRPQKVDRDSMIIRGAKIIGVESRNGRTYSDVALDKLVGFYEGQSVNVDHDRSKPNPERKMSDGFGMLRNVQRRDDGVYGDLHYLGEHSLAPVILERAERMPESFGLSHSAEGRVVRKKGKLIVEDVEAVHSVDIVREPATTKGLFESEGEFDMEIMTIQEIVETVPSDTPGLDFLSEQVGVGNIAQDSQVQVAAGTGASEQIKAAFRAAVVEAFDDETLDIKATIARIKQIMTAQEKLDEEKPAPEQKEEKPAEEAQAVPAKESVEEEETSRINLVEAENLLLKAGRDATPERIKAVAAVDEEDRQVLVESWPEKETHSRPASSPPRHKYDESFEIPKDTKKFAAWLR